MMITLLSGVSARLLGASVASVALILGMILRGKLHLLLQTGYNIAPLLRSSRFNILQVVLVNNGWLDSGWTDPGHKIQLLSKVCLHSVQGLSNGQESTGSVQSLSN